MFWAGKRLFLTSNIYTLMAFQLLLFDGEKGHRRLLRGLDFQKFSGGGPPDPPSQWDGRQDPPTYPMATALRVRNFQTWTP